MGYDFEILYRPGKWNQAADALSRQQEAEAQVQLHALTTIQSSLVPTLLQANQTDPQLLDLHYQLTAGSLGPEYTSRDGLLLFKGKIWVPQSHNLRRLLL